jgi:hypothetical protein
MTGNGESLPREREAPNEMPGEGSSTSEPTAGGGQAQVNELLDRGFEPCGADFLTVNVRLRSCGRPVNHPYPHKVFADQADVDAAPYPEPPEELADMLERSDRAYDEGVWRP